MQRTGIFTASIFFCMFLFCGSVNAGLCEFDAVEQAEGFGWELLREKSLLEVTTDSRAGKYALKVTGQDGMAEYGGIRVRFRRGLDLAGVRPDDSISFYLKQNVATGFVVNINGGAYYRFFPASRNEWTKVELDMDLKNWSGMGERWEKINWIEFYERNLNSSDKYMVIDGLKITVGGKEVSPSDLMPAE